ncbi:MAG: hypothetical protein ACR2NW_03245 [Thermodesulfobacteriota bacterium]
MDISLRLEYPDDRKPLYSLDDINSELAVIGTKIWTLDLKDISVELKTLLKKTVLTDEERSKVMEHFLLPMDKLLKIVEKAGRTPNIEGGGELSTTVTTHGYSYPQLYLVEEGVDYTRFDRLHYNESKDGVGIDEILQLISGGDFVMHQLMPNKSVLKVFFRCPDENTGWLITYDGKTPHIGSLSSSDVGTKLVVQAIGPKEWDMNYID